MEKLLSKLGNYFNKGIKVGALTAAVLMGAGCDLDQGEQQPTYQAVDYDQYLPETYIFLRHRFVEKDGKIQAEDSTKDKIAWANRHYNDAAAYMREKIADFQRKVREEEPAGNFLQPVLDEIFVDEKGNPDDGFENFVQIDQVLGSNTSRYAELLGSIGAMSQESYVIFSACYDKLGLSPITIL